jgi:hypothetical protein
MENTSSRQVNRGDAVPQYSISGTFGEFATPDLLHSFARNRTQITVLAYVIRQAQAPLVERLWLGYVGQITVKDGFDWEIEVISRVHGADQPRNIGHTVDCNNRLGDRLCRKQVTQFQIFTTVSTIVAPRSVFTISSALPANVPGNPTLIQYEAGHVAFTSRIGQHYQISDIIQSGLTLTIYLANPTQTPIVVGESIVLTPGCDLTEASCIQYANITNFLAPAIRAPTTAARFSGI